MRNYLLTGPTTYYPTYYWVRFDLAVTPAKRIFIAAGRNGLTAVGAVDRVTMPARETGVFTPGGSIRIYTPSTVDRTDE